MGVRHEVVKSRVEVGVRNEITGRGVGGCTFWGNSAEGLGECLHHLCQAVGWDRVGCTVFMVVQCQPALSPGMVVQCQPALSPGMVAQCQPALSPGMVAQCHDDPWPWPAFWPYRPPVVCTVQRDINHWDIRITAGPWLRVAVMYVCHDDYMGHNGYVRHNSFCHIGYVSQWLCVSQWFCSLEWLCVSERLSQWLWVS